jgi:hypothetical protein
MRKHKSVVAVLLAVMMIFTFMPTMAFANTQDDHGVWNDTFDQYQIGGQGAWYAVVPELASTSNGFNNYNVTNYRNSGMQVSSYTVSGQTDRAYFYNLKDAKVVAPGQDPAGNISRADYNSLVSDGVAVSVYVKDSGTTYYGTSVTGSAATNYHTTWTAKVTGEPIEENFNGNKKVTLPVSFTSSGSSVAGLTYQTPALLNAELSLTLNVTDTITPSNVWVVDGVEEGSKEGYVEPTALKYNGADHTIALKDYDNCTAVYEKYNATAAKWEKVDSITIKDVASKNAQYRAYLVKTGTTTKVTAERPVTPTVVKTDAPKFTWDEYDTATGYAIANGTEYDPASYVVVKSSLEKTKDNYKNNDAAVKANETELLAYFNDFYTVEKTTSKANPSVETLSIEKKTLTSAETKELNKKYEQLLLNFTTPVAVDDAKPQVTVVTEENNIDITAISSVTYSGSKTTKAGKLKANKTITVKAVADSGEAVSFKLVDAPSKITINKKTGKITVKKGLKKGTYKFYVRAQVKASKGWTGATEYHTIKVYVKK